MSIYTMAGDTNKGWIDRGLDKLGYISGYAQRFNTHMAPIVDSVRNVVGLGSLGSAIYQGATGSIGQVMDSSRLSGVLKSLNTLEAHRGYFAKDPESFSSRDMETVGGHLSSVGKFIKAYDKQPSTIPQTSIDRIKDLHYDYSDMFSPEEFANTRQQMINSNNQKIIEDTLKQITASSNAKSFPQDTSETHNLFYDFQRKLAEYTNAGFPIESYRGIENAVDEYVANRNVNTKEGIRNSLKAIKNLTYLANENPNYLTLNTLNKMKYDLAVRSKKWAQ